MKSITVPRTFTCPTCGKWLGGKRAYWTAELANNATNGCVYCSKKCTAADIWGPLFAGAKPVRLSKATFIKMVMKFTSDEKRIATRLVVTSRVRNGDINE